MFEWGSVRRASGSPECASAEGREVAQGKLTVFREDFERQGFRRNQSSWLQRRPAKTSASAKKAAWVRRKSVQETCPCRIARTEPEALAPEKKPAKPPEKDEAEQKRKSAFRFRVNSERGVLCQELEITFGHTSGLALPKFGKKE